jgi:hypothetical protein
MLRLVTGILKGLLAGAAVGAGAYYLGITSGTLLYVVYGAVGALVGLICGKPPWKQETLWTPAVKAAFGFAIGAAVYYGWNRLLGGFELPMAASLGAPHAPMSQVPYLLGGAIGIVYGAFVEIDDGGKPKNKPLPPDHTSEKKA